MDQTIIVGAGPAGMLAAITASAAGDQVLLIDHQKIAGKKILSTGNGRCNLTNLKQEPSFYHSSEHDFMLPALKAFDEKAVIRFFESLGIQIRDRDGYCYPRSMQASVIREVLEEEVLRRGVELRTEQNVTDIVCRINHGFLVKTEETSFSADRVILAAGGKAAGILGSDGSGYRLAENLGHSIIEPVPALTGLKLSRTVLKKASGVRTQVKISLFSGKTLLTEDTGELQITDYGISGIPVFQVSSFAGRELLKGKKPLAVLDFLPEYTFEEAGELITGCLRKKQKTLISVLSGFFPEKLCTCIIKEAGLMPFLPSERVDDRVIKRLLCILKGLSLEICGINDFSKAQVTSGGIDCREVDPVTMESRIKPGLFFAGEILDVDGICGGYNLQWAWSSGYAAGRNGRDVSLIQD